MYHALEGLQEAVDGDLDTEEAARIEANLAVAKQSDRKEIVSLADTVSNYLQQERQQILLAEPNLWKRIVMRFDALGQRFKRSNHRGLITASLILWVVLVVSSIVEMILGGSNLDAEVLQWRWVLIGIQSVVGGLMITAVYYWWTGYEERGLRYAIWGVLLSLVALQLLYFYISQLLAITSTMLQFTFLLILLSYRRWHLTLIP
jgi:hypothetical protein